MGMGDAVFSLARIGLAAGEDADRAQGRPREKSMA